MLVIADSSALIALSICEALDLTLKLYGDLRIPQAVYNEIVVKGKAQSENLESFLNGRVVSVNLSQWVLAAGRLGRGELEAMALYKQLAADVLLIDDRRARAVAEHNQIVCVGTLGFLLLAKSRGMIQRVTPYVEKLRGSSLYYGDELLEKALLLANE
jgi:predicted nucleic acid-binding protein